MEELEIDAYAIFFFWVKDVYAIAKRYMCIVKV